MADKKSNIKCYASIAIIGVIVLWVLSLFFWFPDSTDIGILFSGLAFAGIIITALLQREELKFQRTELELQRTELELQRKEFELQRKALERQGEEFRLQNKTMKLQQFENTFFNLLNLLQKIVDGIDTKRTKGCDAFQEYYRDFKNGHLKKENEVKKISQKYSDYYHKKLRTDFGHYFRTVYRIIELIDETDFSFEQRYRYVSILRAKLSDYELVWLFYNCISEKGIERYNQRGEEKFKRLIEEYSVFRNLPIDEIHNYESLKKEYADSAFEKDKLSFS